MGTINWVAVLVAGISAFVIGGVWYSPGLFGRAWMKDNNLAEESHKKKQQRKNLRFYAYLFIADGCKPGYVFTGSQKPRLRSKNRYYMGHDGGFFSRHLDLLRHCHS